MYTYSEYTVSEKVKKLAGKSRDDALKLIWGWIQERHLSFGEFRDILSAFEKQEKRS